MNYYYEDIIDKINEEPQWFDENMVPRYCKFSPSKVSNIYSDEVVLYEVACQSCGTRFLVADSDNKSFRRLKEMEYGISLMSIEERVDKDLIGCNDPPNMHCCPAGPTMSSDFIKVVEYWKKDNFDWVRQHLEKF